MIPKSTDDRIPFNAFIYTSHPGKLCYILVHSYLAWLLRYLLLKTTVFLTFKVSSKYISKFSLRKMKIRDCLWYGSKTCNEVGVKNISLKEKGIVWSVYMLSYSSCWVCKLHNCIHSVATRKVQKIKWKRCKKCLGVIRPNIVQNLKAWENELQLSSYTGNHTILGTDFIFFYIENEQHSHQSIWTSLLEYAYI